MKIVNLEKFLKFPVGTLFCVYSEFGYEFLNLMVKDKNWTVEGPNNFFFQDLHEVHNDGRERSKILDKAIKEGTSFSFDLSEPGRIGPWEEETLFAVYERPDILQLMKVLEAANIASIPPAPEGFVERPSPMAEKFDAVVLDATKGMQDGDGDFHSDLNISKEAAAAWLEQEYKDNPKTDRFDQLMNKDASEEDLVRSNENGSDTNYGKLLAWNIGGMPFLIREEYADKLGLPAVELKDTPRFVTDFRLEMSYGPNQFVFYALEKEDIAQLVVVLSKRYPDYTVGVGQHGRWLQTFVGGNAQFPRRTIDYYFSGLGKEEIENSKF